MAAKISPQAWTTGTSRLATCVDHELAHAGVDEHDLDHDDADHEVGEVEHDDVDDRRERVGQRVAEDDPRARQAFELGHLDVGAGHDVDDRGAGHAHHVRDHDQRQRRDRQRDRRELLAERMPS